MYVKPVILLCVYLHACLRLCRSVKIGLLLLRELKQESRSPWYRWIQALPTNFDTLLHWSPEELLQLQMNSTSAEQQFLEQAGVVTAPGNMQATLHAWTQSLQAAHNTTVPKWCRYIVH